MEENKVLDEDMSNSPLRDDNHDDGNDEGEHNEKANKEEDTSPTISASTLTPFKGEALPYDLSSLTWDSDHLSNKENIYCYCGKHKSNDSPMYRCSKCSQWFHLECLKDKPLYAPLRGDSFYTFTCSLCNNGELEKMEVVANKPWTDIVRVALWNLVLEERQKGSNRVFFQYKDEICKYLRAHWTDLCAGKEKTKTWENTVGSNLSTKVEFFLSGQTEKQSHGWWGLRDNVDPSLVRKARGGLGKPKKKKTDGPTSEAKRRKVPLKVFMEADNHFHPCHFNYDTICVAKENSATEVKISSDRLTVSNDKGYRTARASFGVSEGTWYFEFLILDHSGNTRLGWSTEKGSLEAPVGFDQYSYSYRDKEGTSFSQSHGHPYGNPYGPKDIIGCLIELPTLPESDPTAEVAKEEQPNTANPSTAAAGQAAKKEKVHPKSKITFYKNGIDQGTAFTEIFQGTYYPAASMYGGGAVQFNFGPSFQFPPPSTKNYRPVCDVVPIVIEKEKLRAEKEEKEEKEQAERDAKEDAIETNGNEATAILS